MKTLIQAYELIQLLSSFHFLSPTLVRASNPQTYTFYCSYSPEERSDWNISGRKHIITCNNLGCSYYRRMIWGIGGTVAGVTSATGAYLAAPITGGLSLVAAAFATVYVKEVFVAGTRENMEGIENQLKEKWENEQKDAKINDLQRQLTNTQKQLTKTANTRDEYKRKYGERSSSYLREKRKTESLENQVGNLKKELCREKGCRCGGNCI